MSTNTTKTDRKLKTFATRLPIAIHDKLSTRAEQDGIGMAELGAELVDQYLSGQIQLKVRKSLTKELASELEQLEQQFSNQVELLKALRTLKAKR